MINEQPRATYLLPSVEAVLRRLAAEGGRESYFENEDPRDVFGPAAHAAITNGYVVVDTGATAGFHHALKLTDKGWAAIDMQRPLSIFERAWNALRGVTG